MYFFKLYNFEHQLYFLYFNKKTEVSELGNTAPSMVVALVVIVTADLPTGSGRKGLMSCFTRWESQAFMPAEGIWWGGRCLLLYCHLPAKGGWPFWIGFPLFRQRPPVHSGSWVTGSSCYPCSGLNWPGMRWVLLDLLIDVRFPAPWEGCNDTANPKSFDL